MHRSVYLSLLGVCIALGLASTRSALAQAPNDPASTTDPFNGATIDHALSSAEVPCCGITSAGAHDFPLENMFGGTTSGNNNTFDEAIFNDGVSVASPAVVYFTRTNTTSIKGVNLFTGGDAGAFPETESAPRSTANFIFEADADNNGSFETTLVASGDPIDDRRSNYIAFINPTTATNFRATFVNGDIDGGGCCTGPRVVELDAVPGVPEPSTIALLSLGLVWALPRRRTA